MTATPPHNDGLYVGSYRDASIHKMMLQDVIRTNAYEEAILQLVRSESRVIDFGSGSGVLAIFARRAGAARVDAIERTVMVESAREIARLSGYPDIHFHHADHSTFKGEGKADILVSEWMGHFLFYEAMLEPLLAIRDRWLAEDGVMVPKTVSMHAALVVSDALHDDLSFLRGNPYGIDFSPICDVPLHQCLQVQMEERDILDTVIELGSLDMRTVKGMPKVMTGTAKMERAALAYGILGWFSTDLTEDVSFGTGPKDPLTHWQQLFFPLPEPFEVSPHREVTVSISPPQQTENEEGTWSWSIRDALQEQAVDEADTFRRFDPKPLPTP